MLALNNLVSVSEKRKRVGRGGSRGGTSGRGHKGQKARTSGTVGPLFEGGQMPLHRRLPKRGFSNLQFKVSYEIVNLGQLNNMFESGTQVTKELLIEKGLLSNKKKALLKVLGKGELTKKLIIHADACSKQALELIEKCGGEFRVNQER